MTITETAPAPWAPPTPPSDDAGTATSTRRAIKGLAALAILAVGATSFVLASLAVFTDTETIENNTFGTGTVDLTTNFPSTAAFTVPAIAPGDEEVREITVNNVGSLDFRYALVSVTTGDQTLAAALDLTVRSGVTDCSVANWDATGTVVSPAGDLGAVTPGRAIFGDVAQGPQTGDRTLAVSGSETLCFHVTLPLSASGVEGESTSADFVFEAEQTSNNT